MTPPWLWTLDTCPSTNTWAIEQERLCTHGRMIFTRQQTAGRGQWGRQWYSPPGVLTASLVVDQPTNPYLGCISLGAALAIIYALEDLCPELTGRLRLKWPNDIWLQDRKLCGLLIEAIAAQEDRPSRLVIGIGCNCSVDFSQAEHPVSANTGSVNGEPIPLKTAISLGDVINKIPDELTLLSQCRHYLLELISLIQWQQSKVNQLSTPSTTQPSTITPSTRTLPPGQPPAGFQRLLAEINHRDYLRDRPSQVITPQNHYQGRNNFV